MFCDVETCWGTQIRDQARQRQRVVILNTRPSYLQQVGAGFARIGYGVSTDAIQAQFFWRVSWGYSENEKIFIGILAEAVRFEFKIAQPGHHISRPLLSAIWSILYYIRYF
jgi:hypothetical protein